MSPLDPVRNPFRHWVFTKESSDTGQGLVRVGEPIFCLVLLRNKQRAKAKGGSVCHDCSQYDTTRAETLVPTSETRVRKIRHGRETSRTVSSRLTLRLSNPIYSSSSGPRVTEC